MLHSQWDIDESGRRRHDAMLRHTGLAHSCQARTTSRHPGTSVDSERPRPEITFLTWAFLVELPGIEPDPSRPAETSRLKTRKHAKLRVATCGYVERCWRCNSNACPTHSRQPLVAVPRHA